MSHFCGIVFGHENNLDDVLAPFDENLAVDEYIYPFGVLKSITGPCV